MTTPTANADFLSPGSKVLTQYINPHTKATQYAFPLQTQSWLKLQMVVTTALGFPLTKDDFTNLYGTFTDEGTVEQAVTVLGQIRTTATQYGDPTTLLSSIKQFENASPSDPPKTIYGHAVFLAAQTQTTAQQIGTLLNQGLDDIGIVQDPKTRLAELTELLTGRGGVNDLATGLRGQIETFNAKVIKFLGELNPELTGPSNSLQSYLNQSSNVLKDAKQAVQHEDELINGKDGKGGLIRNIKHLNDEYTGFTIAASLAPLFLLIPIFGPLLAVADAATFAALAITVKKEIAVLQKSLKKDEGEKKKKVALVAVLGHFNASALDVETDGEDFVKALNTLVAGWVEFVNEINAQLADLTEDDVKDWSAFLQKVNFQASLVQWNLIASTAQTFFKTGFASFSKS